MHQASLGARCGRDTGYPAPPAQIPACGFPAPGSSMVLASVIFTIKTLLLPSVRLACIIRPCVSGAKFPLRSTYHCQPLPHVNGPTVSEYYELIRLPASHQFPRLSVRLSYPSMMGTYRVSQVPDTSLPACHGLRTPAALRNLAIAQCSEQALQRVCDSFMLAS